MARPKASQPSKPDWFDSRNYDWVKNLTASGWLQQLRRLYELSVDQNLGWHRLDPHIHLDFSSGKAKANVVSLPPVFCVSREDAGTIVPTDMLPALIVQIQSPDELIVSELKRLLPLYRKKFGIEISAPGKYALNGHIGTRTFQKWNRHQIIQFADLIEWRATLDPDKRKAYSQTLFGTWLGLDKRARDDARIVLKNALACLPILAMQMALKGPPRKRTSKKQPRPLYFPKK